jgi:uncharacterized membrane protein
MTVHGSALLTIVLMAAVTYLLRAGGYWLIGRFPLSPRIEAALTYLPGAVLTALVIPAVIDEPGPGVPALVVVAFVMRKTGNLFLALAGGVFTVWLVRQVIG